MPGSQSSIPPSVFDGSSANASISTTAAEVERFLTRRLAVEVPRGEADDWDEMEEDEDLEEEVVRLALRYDAHWLKCQPLKFGPLMTVLGLYEEEGHPNLPLQLDILGLPKTTSKVLPPHSEWNRGEVATLPPLFGEDQDKEMERIHRMVWMDLRGNAAALPETRAEAWEFLSGLLGNGHDSSPWRFLGPASSSSSSLLPADMVLLIAPAPVPALQDLRVTDACPSWFLHGYAYLEALEAPPLAQNALATNAVAPLGSADALPATVYMYKRLKRRVRLSRDLPQGLTPPTGAPPRGCLWEAVHPKDNREKDKEEDDESDDCCSDSDDEHDEPQEIVHRLVSPPYLSLRHEYGEEVYQGLFSKDALETFRREALAIPQWTPWPETQHYSVGPNGETTWTVFPLCYCFPANDVRQRKWVDQTAAFCQDTTKILKAVLGDQLRTALFSRLAPDTVLEAHTGWADLANHVLRLHIPLVVPAFCGAWVDGCVETHASGRPLLFDDSKIHRAFNYHPTQDRIVLIVDLERPANLPKGYATGGHSEELDHFISQMQVPK